MKPNSTTNKNGQEVGFRFLLDVLWKTVVLFLAFNVLFALFTPLSWLGKLSAYNLIWPGRERLPFGEIPQDAYNLSLNNLNAMFASHEISNGSKPADEFRILVIGDSSVWGFLLQPDDTFTGKLNALNLRTDDGRSMRAYNLGFPVMSLLKDVMILEKGLQFDPDLILWFVTLESFPIDKQFFSALVQNDIEWVREIIQTYDLPLDPNHSSLIKRSFLEESLFSRRRDLADLVRLQLYGALWAATGIDQVYPDTFELRAEDLSDEVAFHGLEPPEITREDLALEVISTGLRMASDIPVIIINEPMFISQGENSHIRYNFFYPRWVYDQYREILVQESLSSGWYFIDLWDLIPGREFTNTAIHLTPAGSSMLADALVPDILNSSAHVPSE